MEIKTNTYSVSQFLWSAVQTKCLFWVIRLKSRFWPGPQFYLRLWVPFHAQTGGWQNTVPHDCTTKVLTSLVSVKWGPFLANHGSLLQSQHGNPSDFRTEKHLRIWTTALHLLWGTKGVPFIWCLFLVFGSAEVFSQYLVNLQLKIFPFNYIHFREALSPCS